MTIYYAQLKSKHNNKVKLTSPQYASSKHAAAWVKRKMKMHEYAELYSEIKVVVEE